MRLHFLLKQFEVKEFWSSPEVLYVIEFERFCLFLYDNNVHVFRVHGALCLFHNGM